MPDVDFLTSQDWRTPGIFIHNPGSTERQKYAYGGSSVIENTISIKNDQRRKAICSQECQKYTANISGGQKTISEWMETSR